MAWRSIWSKKGRSALTILSIFIGIAAVMTIVSVMEGMKAYTREQNAAMGSNKVNVYIYSWMYDENGNSMGKDYFPDLYDYCNSLAEYVDGVTPVGWCNATVSYGTKSSANMEYTWDEKGNLIGDRPPTLHYGSDQYSVCNNLTIAKGRDLAYLDMTNYNQVCVLGAQAAKAFFGSADPVGHMMQVNGHNFEVVGVYGPRLTGEAANRDQMDNLIVFPYTTRRILGGENPTEYQVKVKESDMVTEVISRIGGFLKGAVDTNSGGYDVSSNNQWQEYENEQMTLIGLVLGGIAAISLLVGGIGIMNIMLVTVTERTREIGIRRAIGAQKSSIVTQFLVEAGMLCGIGGLVGVAVGTLGSIILGKLMFQMTIYPLPWVTAAALALAVTLGLVFGIYPAAKAARLQPVEALRAE
jgi:putative ABC transport system permease protein